MPKGSPSTDISRRRRTLSAGGFAHFIHDGFTDGIFVLLPLWASGFGLNHAQVGILKACMSGSLAIFQVPAGLLAERIGERAVLAMGTALAGAGFALLALADGFLMLAVFLVISGLGGATQHPLASALVSKAYVAGGRRAAIGIYNFSGDLGKVAVPVSIAAIAAAAGWQAGTVAYGLVGVCAGVAIYLVLRRLDIGTAAGPAESAASARRKPAGGTGWGISDRRGFTALSTISVIDTSSRLGFLTFMPFLLIDKGAATQSVGFAVALVLAGGAAGKLVCGLVAERAGILRTVVLTELASVVLIGAVIALPLVPALIVLPVLGLALNGTSSVLYGTVGDFVHADRQARAFGLFYTLGVGVSAVAPFVYGMLSDAFGLETALTACAATILLILPICLVLRPSLIAAEAAE